MNEKKLHFINLGYSVYKDYLKVVFHLIRLCFKSSREIRKRFQIFMILLKILNFFKFPLFVVEKN